MQEADRLRRWNNDLWGLVTRLQRWAGVEGWQATVHPTKLRESGLGGEYTAPGLQLRRGRQVLILQPMGCCVPGCLGRVDLYRSPRYDNIWHLILYPCGWFFTDLSQTEREWVELDDKTFSCLLELAAVSGESPAPAVSQN